MGLIAAAAPAARACSLCGCGDPLVDASDSVPRAAPLRLALDFEHLTASAATEEDPAVTEEVSQQTVRPVVVYSPIPSVNLVLQVPFVRKALTVSGPAVAAARPAPRAPDGAAGDELTHVGLGDVDLGARWFFLEARDLGAQARQALGVSAGTTLPTGPNDLGENGERLDDHAQLGAGSFGPYLGLVYAYHRDPWNLFTSVTGRVHSTNGHGYRYGSSLQLAARLDYRLVDALALEAGLDGRQAMRDTVDGVDQENTGGFVLAAAPGVAVNLAGDVWLRARLQIPVITSLYGEQSVELTAFASVQVLLE